jgi:uncharacterized surface protein with fasciclin (FAS1) repeats
MISQLVVFALVFVQVAFAQSIVDTANEGTNAELKGLNFSTLVAAVSARPAIAALLSDTSKKLTVFAPTDDAFKKITLPSDSNVVTDILTYHVSETVVETVDKTAFVKTLYKSPGLDNDFQVVKASKDGDVVTVGNAKVLKTVKVGNSVIHAIDTVLSIPESPSKTLVAAGTFKSLAASLTKVGLLDDVDDAKKITIFAPNDDAFAKLTATPSDAQLQDILKYHVVIGVAYSTDLKPQNTFKTLQGKDVNVTVANGVVTVNGQSKVIKADFLVSNGVVHVIDSVLSVPTTSTNTGTENKTTNSAKSFGPSILLALLPAIFLLN